VAQRRVLDEDPPKGADIVPRVIVPGVTGERGHDLVELCGGLLDKRVDQLVLAAEVPVDTGDSDTEMASELGHAQLIDTLRLDEFEGLRDDLRSEERRVGKEGRRAGEARRRTRET